MIVSVFIIFPIFYFCNNDKIMQNEKFGLLTKFSNIKEKINLACKEILPPDPICLGSFLPKQIEEMRIDYGILHFEIKSEEVRNKIIQAIENIELVKDYLWEMGVGIPATALTVKGDGKEVKFNEFIYTLDISVNGQKFSDDSYGYYPKDTKSSELVQYLYSTYLNYVFNPYLEATNPHKIYYNRETDDYGWSYPVYVETEDVLVSCSMDTMGKDMYTLFNYESIKDFNFIKEGYTAFENEHEITEFSNEIGTHIIFLSRDEERYVLPYFCE